MKESIVNYLLLILVIILSFLSIYRFDFFPNDPNDKSLDNFRLLTPGVLFSLYIIFLQKRNWTIGKLILFFCLLLALYFISLIAGFTSWGIAVPFAGGIGALLMKQLFYQKTELLDYKGKRYALLGFVSGLIGLVSFYIVQKIWTAGVGLGIILVIWQLVIGALWIRQIESERQSESKIPAEAYGLQHLAS